MGRPVVHWELNTSAGIVNGGIVKPDRENRSKVVAAGGISFCLFSDPDGRMMGLWKAK